MSEVASVKATVGLDTTELKPATKEAVRSFKDIESAATKTGSAIDKTSDRLNKSAGITKAWEQATAKAKTAVENSTKAISAETIAVEKNTSTKSRQTEVEKQCFENAIKATAARNKAAQAIDKETEAIKRNNAEASKQTHHTLSGVQVPKSSGGGIGDKIGLGAGSFSGKGANEALSGLIIGEVLKGVWEGSVQIQNLHDKYTGRSTPDNWMEFLNPFRREDPNIGRATNGSSELAAFRASNKGLSPREQLLQEQMEKRREGRSLAANNSSAEFMSTLKSAESRLEGLEQEEKLQKEIQTIIPILTARRQKLYQQAEVIKKDIQKDPQANAEYYKTLSEIADLEGTAIGMRRQQAKLVRDKQEKNKRLAEEAQEISFQNAVRYARINQGDRDPENMAQDEASQVVPVIRQRMAQLAEQAKGLVKSAQTNGEDRKKYYQLQTQYITLEQEAANLAENASKEITQKEKKAREQERKASEMWYSASIEQAKARASIAKDGEQAQADLNEVWPVLEARQNQLRNEAQQFGRNTEEYADKVKEFWQIETQQQSLVERMNKERAENAKKAVQKQKDSIKTQMDIIGGKRELREAELANNPFLSERQKQQSMLPLLMEQLKVLGRAPKDETEEERLKRQTQIQRTRGEIYSAHGLMDKGVDPRMINRKALGRLEGSINSAIASGAQTDRYKPTLPYSDSYLRSQVQNAGNAFSYNINIYATDRQQLEELFNRLRTDTARKMGLRN